MQCGKGSELGRPCWPQWHGCQMVVVHTRATAVGKDSQNIQRVELTVPGGWLKDFVAPVLVLVHVS